MVTTNNFFNMKFFLKFFVFLIFIFLCVFFINKNNLDFSNNILQEDKYKNFIFIKIKDTLLKTEVVRENKEMARGLSGRENIKSDEGMLFVFDKEDKHAFWMKDMKFSIDMIFLDKNKKIVYIKENAMPESFPETFGGEYDSFFVLEVVSGFANKNDLKVGDILEFQ